MQEKTAPPPFPALEALARATPGSAPETGLVDRLRQELQAVGPAGLVGALDAFAAALAAGGHGPRLVARMAAAPDAPTRRLALELAARLPLPLPPALVTALRPLLLDRSLPLELQLTSSAALLRSLAADSPAADEVLQAVVAGLGKAKAVERLDQLETRIGRLPALVQLRERLEEQLPARCPRCPRRLPRAELVKHVWLEHRLILDGRHAREPWDLAAELVRSYAARRDPAALARGFELAENADAGKGPARVRALLREQALRDGTDEAPPVEAAARDGATICPRCHAAVALKKDEAPRPLTVSRGRVAGGGYVVEVFEDGWEPWLEAQTPRGVLQRGPEEGPRWTPRAAVLLLVGPPVLLAVVVAAAFSLFGLPGMVPVTLLLWLAALAYLFTRVRALFTGAPADRAVDHAWRLLVPRMHAGGFDRGDADFVAGLALASVGRGNGEERAAALQGLLALTDRAVTSGAAAPGHLAALWRLAAADAAALGSDPVLAVARQISRALEGSLPLAFADRLLESWESPWWGGGNLARLRALVCDRAFEAGFTVADLVAVGRGAPPLGEVLQTDDREGLARLRYLWALQAARPWSNAAAARTVFELAAHPGVGTRPLEQRPDLLLLPTLPDVGPERRFGSVVEVCTGGVRVGGTLLTERPRSFEVRRKVGPGAGGYELVVGPYKFWFRDDPEVLGWRLERWCRWYFEEFVPQVPRDGRTSGLVDRLRLREAVTCSECGQRFEGGVGEVGVSAASRGQG